MTLPQLQSAAGCKNQNLSLLLMYVLVKVPFTALESDPLKANKIFGPLYRTGNTQGGRTCV